MFVVLESKQLIPAQGFEHVKGYAGFAAGKLRGCSEHVLFFHMLGIVTPTDYYFSEG